MATPREEIEEILVDSYGEDEQVSSWEVAFTDGVETPCPATLLGLPVEVQQFRVSDANTLQCLVVREKAQRQRWIAVEELDEDPLPDDFSHLLSLYTAWLEGDYWTYDRHPNTEILSMGMEEIYNDPARFAKRDPDYFDFVLDVLRGEKPEK